MNYITTTKAVEFLNQWFNLNEFDSLTFSKGNKVDLQGVYESDLVKRTIEAIGGAGEKTESNGFVSFSFKFGLIEYTITFTK